MNNKGKKKKNQVVVANIFEQQEILTKAELIKSQLMASTWRELETNGKFDITISFRLSVMTCLY